MMPRTDAAEPDALAIGISQLPSTFNPNLDPMAAKSYVLGMTLRPFTVYDADWKLVCLLGVTLPPPGASSGQASFVSTSSARRAQ